MKGVYINLDKRVDRKEHFEKNVKSQPIFSEIERMKAMENMDGAIGCGMSHIKALSLLKSADAPYVAVIEDDFMLFDEEALIKFIIDFNKIKDSHDWDIIVLTPRGITVPETNDMTAANFKRIRENQTTTGYIVKKSMIDILIINIKDAIRLQINGVDKNTSSIDQYWKRLQTSYRFYYYTDVFAGQLPGWSNIENRMVDYNDRFRNQRFF
jgi:GR25 family glycosyltransferase involved in LPS biosynthesis